MAGTRTAPDPSVAATTSVISTLHLIDASGDQFTDAIKTATPPSAANIQTWATAYQAASNASLWKISQSVEWEGDRDADNAVAAYRASVKSGVNLSYKNLSTLSSQTPRLVAPVAATMQGNQDIPLLTADEFTALLTALATLLTGFNLQSAQYTDQRERSNNPRIKV